MLGASSALVRSISKGHVLPAVWRACYAGYATGEVLDRAAGAAAGGRSVVDSAARPAGSGGKVIELQTDSEYQAALKELSASQRAAILDFTATWCGPCKMIAPVLDSLAAEFPSISFYKIDIDKEVCPCFCPAQHVC